MLRDKKDEETFVPRKQARRGRKLHRLSVDTYLGRDLIKLNRESSAEEWIQLPANSRDIRNTWVSGPKFPKLDECTHFHYDTVTLGEDFNVSLRTNYSEHEHQQSVNVYYVHVQSRDESWTIARRYVDVATFDTQLHRCIFDRRYSALPALSSEEDVPSQFEDAFAQLVHYFERFTQLVKEAVHVKCGSVLNWLEMDNRGQHFLWHINSGINVPAIAVATVARNYVKREDDELELRVGDLVSIIDMPNAAESPWWRGKHSNKVGFFPSSCVEIIPGSVHDSNTTRKQASKLSLKCDPGTGDQVPPEALVDGSKKKKKLKGRLAVLFASRPDRDSLRQKGILRGRVFGAHLSEHLFDTDMSVPLIVQVCCTTVESHGIIDGVYRKSGINSNIQRLRQEFDSDSPPTQINEERYMNDIHCVASLCKMYFRELPDPLLTFQLYDQFAEAVSFESVERKLAATRKVVHQLPPFHYSTLAFLAKHLSVVASYAGVHGMHSRNLALVWAPNLLKPLASESDASAFTEIKIQSVVLQFLIDHAKLIFSDEDPAKGTPTSVRLSVSSQVTTGSCSSPQDNMSQTSSIQLVQGAGMRAQRRQINRLSYPDSGNEATADVVRSRTTSDLTHVSTPTAARYQYLMKIPLMELAEAQRAHAVSETDLLETDDLRGKSFFRRKENKKKKLNGSAPIRHSQDYTPSSSHWARSILNKFSIRRTQSLHRPVISGPCGFVADPYSTVVNEAQCIGAEETSRPEVEHNSVSSKLSSVTSSAINSSNVLLLGNVTSLEHSGLAVDKSDFVNEWCTDTIKQFLDGKPLSSIQPTNVTDRAMTTPTSTKRACNPTSPDHNNNTKQSPRCEVRRSKSLPHKRRNKKNEDIAFVLKELEDISPGEDVTPQVRERFNNIIGNSKFLSTDQNATTKRSSINLEEKDARPAKLPRPMSCPSCVTDNTTPALRKSSSLRHSITGVVLIQRLSMTVTYSTDNTHLMA